MRPITQSGDAAAGTVALAILLTGVAGCTSRPSRPTPLATRVTDSANARSTAIHTSPDGAVEIRSMATVMANQFTLSPIAPYEWVPFACEFRVWGGGEDRLESLLSGSPPLLVSSTPHSVICMLPARDNAGRPSRAAMAVEFQWKAVAAGKPERTGCVKLEFFVEQDQSLVLRNVLGGSPEKRAPSPVPPGSK